MFKWYVASNFSCLKHCQIILLEPFNKDTIVQLLILESTLVFDHSKFTWFVTLHHFCFFSKCLKPRTWTMEFYWGTHQLYACTL